VADVMVYVHVYGCTANKVFLSATLEQNTLLLPRLTESGTPELTLTSPQLIHTCLLASHTGKHTCPVL